MYRCTECNTEYEVCPDFCECGNDTFEEIQDVNDVQEEYYERPVKKKKVKKISPEEAAELREEALDKKKAMITVGVSLILCFIILFLPPHRAKKIKKQSVAVENPRDSKIIDVDSYWDSSLPSHSRKKDPYANLPVLNASLGSISSDMREYLKHVGSEYNRLWDRAGVTEEGECRIVFTINKDGVLELNKMMVASNKKSLDDSVLLLISKIKSFDVPPDDYKGQKIIIAFAINADGSNKVYFPSK